MPITSESESSHSELSEDESEAGSEDLPSSPHKGKGKGKATESNNNIIVETAFDAYFTYNKPGRVQTSSNVYSQLVPPPSAEEYSEAIGSISNGLEPIQPALLNGEHCQNLFSRYICELNEGFNILCYGLGSKRRILNQFATTHCSKQGHVVIGNGFQPNFNLKDLLSAVEDNVPAIKKLDWPSTTVEKQGRRIYDFFAHQTSQKSHHIYIVIHNIDAAPLRTAKSKSILALIAHNPRIHIIASIDHLNAPLLWSSSEIFSRKPDQTQINSDTVPSRGFSWLWHDLTTLAAYDFELAFADRSSLSGARRKTDLLTSQNSTAMSETAAFHILASVNDKSQKLFALLGNKQLEAMGNGDNDGATAAAAATATAASNNDFQQFGMAYNLLYSLARDNFLATNESAFRSLQVEFKDHGLFLSTPSGGAGGEIVWIPLRKERLVNVLASLQPANAIDM
jgi:origin recognition complex subunit 2